jgi:hypothetical protein
MYFGTQLPLELGDLGPQRVDHRPQLDVLDDKLLIRRSPTGKHHNMIRTQPPRSTRHTYQLKNRIGNNHTTAT